MEIEPYLDDFAKAKSAESWKQFAKHDPLEWMSSFHQVMNDPNNEIHFNLTGVDYWKGVTRASNKKGGATDWELLQIYQNPAWWPRIQWTNDGQIVPNPFA